MAVAMTPLVAVPGLNGPRTLGWRTWCSLIALIEDLGGDVSAVSMENDGVLIDEATASDWTERLRGVSGHAVLENWGSEFRWRIAGRSIPSWPMPAFFMLSRAAMRQGNVVANAPIEPEDKERDQQLLEELAVFFATCGGFEQW